MKQRWKTIDESMKNIITKNKWLFGRKTGHSSKMKQK